MYKKTINLIIALLVFIALAASVHFLADAGNKWYLFTVVILVLHVFNTIWQQGKGKSELYSDKQVYKTGAGSDSTEPLKEKNKSNN